MLQETHAKQGWLISGRREDEGREKKGKKEMRD